MFWGISNRDKSDYATKDLYKFYCSKSKNPVSYKIFSSILKEFFDYRVQLIIFNNLDLHLPHRMGFIGIRSICDSIKLRKNGSVRVFIDWGKTNKLWEEMYKDKTPQEIKQIKNKPYVYLTNDKTDGRVYDFVWNKIGCNFKYKSHYRFQPTRKWKRKLTEFIKVSKTIQYYEK